MSQHQHNLRPEPPHGGLAPSAQTVAALDHGVRDYENRQKHYPEPIAYNPPPPPTMPTKTFPEIFSALESLDSHVQQMRDLVNEIEGVFTPVLVPPNEDPTSPGSVSQPSSKLAVRIQAADLSLVQAIDWLYAIKRRCAL